MLKMIIKNKIVLGFLFLVVSLVLIYISVNINRNVLDKYKPGDDLVGVWRGSSERFNSSNGNIKKESIDIEFIVKKNGDVSGMVGQLTIINCKLKKNRNNFEKFLNIKTDYIICNGQIKGKINDNDSKNLRDLSIPFNIKNNVLLGSIFEVEGWKYPNPIITKLKLKKD
jgi:hypothetical protein